jgi:S-adenosylmethionine hydrolase
LQPAIWSTTKLSQSVQRLQQYLPEHGIATASIDHPGQGERRESSSFSFANSAEDIVALYNYLTISRKNNFDKVVYIGNSLWSAPGLSASQEFGAGDGIVLVSPVVHPGQFMQEYSQVTWVPVEHIIEKYLEECNLHADKEKLFTEIQDDWSNISTSILKPLSNRWHISSHNMLVTRVEHDKISRLDTYANLPNHKLSEFAGYGDTNDPNNHAYWDIYPQLIEEIGKFILNIANKEEKTFMAG